MSFLFEVPPWPSLDPWAFCPWPQVVVVPMPWPTEVLQVETVCPRPVQPLWEFGHPGVFLSDHPLPQPLCLGLFEALLGLLPCPALVRAAIGLATWFPKSVVPLTGSVVTADLALTLSWASSFFAFGLVGSELGIGGPRIAIKVLYWVPKMFMYPMKKTIFEMLLHLLICDPPRALQPDLVKSPF